MSLPHSRPMPGAASRCHELRVVDEDKTWRIIYRTDLEKSGWKVGSAQEFLQLSDEEAAYVESRLRLADALRKTRRKRRLSQSELAKRIKSSQSRVRKWKAGMLPSP